MSEEEKQEIRQNYQRYRELSENRRRELDAEFERQHSRRGRRGAPSGSDSEEPNP